MRHNLNSLCKSIVRKLQARTDITILPADDSNGTMLIDTTDFLMEAKRQRGDPNFFRFLENDRSPDLFKHTNSNFPRLLNYKEASPECHKYL